MIFIPSRLLILSLDLLFFIFFFFLLSLSLSLPFTHAFSPSLLPFQIWPYEMLQLLHPTLGYIRNDLETTLKWVHIDKKAYKKEIKRNKDWLTTLICPKFYFSTLYDSHVFSYEFNKGFECSKIPYGNNSTSFNLSNERIIHLLSLLIVIIFLFFFSFLFF